MSFPTPVPLAQRSEAQHTMIEPSKTSHALPFSRMLFLYSLADEDWEAKACQQFFEAATALMGYGAPELTLTAYVQLGAVDGASGSGSVQIEIAFSKTQLQGCLTRLASAIMDGIKVFLVSLSGGSTLQVQCNIRGADLSAAVTPLIDRQRKWIHEGLLVPKFDDKVKFTDLSLQPPEDYAKVCVQAPNKSPSAADIVHPGRTRIPPRPLQLALADTAEASSAQPSSTSSATEPAMHSSASVMPSLYDGNLLRRICPAHLMGASCEHEDFSGVNCDRLTSRVTNAEGPRAYTSTAFPDLAIEQSGIANVMRVTVLMTTSMTGELMQRI
ncbi:hypothetical protein P168DRAFT_328117 [Aspergillus campestris IBT 28561]|uniref:Uncharacterized protein n=1 Tax=Aspergillus campestris (strain IBT 28561) TaxID=1392248 RepID=A0A2I1CZH7_ASPC2|nr:uncharacterized protein P168DRAFT_328117 [Aspergillus campestris IBT 28561]PKY03025.1 hypothetical protein P168DRAFT_328117 [Aspergillus campestris IBT 28561]